MQLREKKEAIDELMEARDAKKEAKVKHDKVLKEVEDLRMLKE